MSGRPKIPHSKEILEDVQNHWNFGTNPIIFELVESILAESLKKFPSKSKTKFREKEIVLVVNLFTGRRRITEINLVPPPKPVFFKGAEVFNPDIDRAFDWTTLFNEARDAMIDALPKIKKRVRFVLNSPRQLVKVWYFHNLTLSANTERIERDLAKGFNVDGWIGDELDPHLFFPEFFWNAKAKTVALWFSKNKIAVTPKTIEKARDELRKHHSPRKSL